MTFLRGIVSSCAPSEASHLPSWASSWAVTVDKEPLPADWTAFESFASGRTYYFHRKDNKVQSEHPLGLPYTPGLAAPWERAFNEQGRPYYINHELKTCTWWLPADVEWKDAPEPVMRADAQHIDHSRLPEQDWQGRWPEQERAGKVVHMGSMRPAFCSRHGCVLDCAKIPGIQKLETPAKMVL